MAAAQPTAGTPPAARTDGPVAAERRTPSAAAVRVRGLTRRFGTNVALAPLDLELAHGEITGLVGPNGSGKTTFLRMLVGLVRASAGEIEVAGVRLVGDGRPVRERVAYAPGELGHYGELSLERHLAFLLEGRSPAAHRRALATAERLGLPRGAKVRTFSHGMKRQMLFAAALAPDVPVRLLDEPTEGLDPTKRGEVLAILRDDLVDADGRRCVVLSSHHLAEVERACHRLVFLERGRLLADERSEALERRTRRLLRLAWAPGQRDERLDAWLERLGATQVRWNGDEAAVVLAGDDPRPFLAGLCSARDVPAPDVVQYGRLSVEELYRDLYGVEGL